MSLAGGSPLAALDLTGTWQCLPDREGAYEPWGLPSDEWSPIPVPANWHLAGLPDYSGVVWYKTVFEIPEERRSRRLWLVFDGVDYFAEVWVNGTYLGGHEGYFQPFRFDISPVQRTVNQLLVRVDSPREPAGIWPDHKVLVKGVLNHHQTRPGGLDPDLGQDGNTGGIWNRVWVEDTGLVRITDLRVTPHLLSDGTARLHLAVEVENAGRARDARLVGSVEPEAGSDRHDVSSDHIELPRGQSRHHLIVTVDDPRLWWTWDQGSPERYRASVTLDAGEESPIRMERMTGIRQIWLRDGAFELNGRSIRLRGSNHVPTQWLSEYDAEAIALDLTQLKEANANSIRLLAHVNRPELYEACDRAGVLVWQDFPLHKGYETGDEFATSAVRQAAEMVRLLHHHPSVAVWCCHDQPLANRDTLDPILASAIRTEDPTRPVFEAVEPGSTAFPGWRGGTIGDYSALPGAPIVTAFGAQALPSEVSLRQTLPEPTIWPTEQKDWEVWAYHGFQFDETFHVAEIDRGSNLAEFVEASQRYQAELLERAIITYRVNGVGILFQYLWADSWPAISASVLDYWRIPKQGYEAIRSAYQPVLVVLASPTGARRSVHLLGTGTLLESLADLTVVNDTPETVRGHVELRRQEDTLARLPVEAAPASVVRPVDLPSLLERGEWSPEAQSLLEASERLENMGGGPVELILELIDHQGLIKSRKVERLRLVDSLTTDSGRSGRDRPV